MPRSYLGNFAGGFAQAYFQAKRNKQRREDEKAERKARMQLYEIELKKAQAAQAQAEEQRAARTSLLDTFGGAGFAPETPPIKLPPWVIDESGATGQPGSVGPGARGRKPGDMLLDALVSDPETQLLALRGGMIGLEDLLQLRARQENRNLLAGALGSGPGGGAPGESVGGPPGFALTGVKLDSSGQPMLDFSATSEITRWMPSPDGRSQVGFNRLGQPVTVVPAGPKERAEEDTPLSPSELLNFRDASGRPPPPGTTLRAAQEQGFQPIPTTEAGAEMSQRSTAAVMDRLESLSTKLFTTESGVGRFGQAGEFAVERVFQSNKDLSAYESFANGTIAPLIRSLGEKGTLAEGDVERAINLLPKTRPIPDTKEVAEAKLSQLRGILDAAARKEAKANGGDKSPDAMSDDELLKALGRRRR